MDNNQQKNYFWALFWLGWLSIGFTWFIAAIHYMYNVFKLKKSPSVALAWHLYSIFFFAWFCFVIALGVSGTLDNYDSTQTNSGGNVRIERTVSNTKESKTSVAPVKTAEEIRQERLQANKDKTYTDCKWIVRTGYPSAVINWASCGWSGNWCYIEFSVKNAYGTRVQRYAKFETKNDFSELTGEVDEGFLYFRND